jgi:hypothetical protein
MREIQLREVTRSIGIRKIDTALWICIREALVSNLDQDNSYPDCGPFWLKHYATSRKVAGSTPDEVIGFFN